MERQRDIEIYVHGCSIELVLAWAHARLGPLGNATDGGEATVYATPCGPMVVTPAIEDGPYTSVAFNSARTPWATDVDCARDAAKALGCVVRCRPGQHHPEVPAQSSTWLEVSPEAERLVQWD